MKSITTTSMMPKELEKSLVDAWKFDLLGIQPERSKREDPHLNIRNIPDDISVSELKKQMQEMESKILGCGALNSQETD